MNHIVSIWKVLQTSELDSRKAEALKVTAGTIHKSGVVFICSPAATVVGVLSKRRAVSQKFRAGV